MKDLSGAPATPSLWLDGSPPGAARTVDGNGGIPAGHWDVVVVGAGLAGVSTALRLAEAGARVALLEARTVASRTTGHSTAKVTALHGSIYHSLVAGKGLETATRYAAANQRAVDDVRRLIEIIEDEDRVVQVLENLFESDPDAVGQAIIRIGSETDEEEMDAYSIVTSPYRLGETVGTLGVIGPTRMDYPRAVALVENAADVINRSGEDGSAPSRDPA